MHAHTHTGKIPRSPLSCLCSCLATSATHFHSPHSVDLSHRIASLRVPQQEKYHDWIILLRSEFDRRLQPNQRCGMLTVTTGEKDRTGQDAREVQAGRLPPGRSRLDAAGCDASQALAPTR
ncbi:hypothetical protein BCV69DRAFT_92426 [Microstroma glucosiphilum]|uniref:Uncharacterized protein n=1 Tax=Pseudomicrostroma glucosiphilum TaxID=1684307 RepID=A0A316UBW2_9BASI|nr:hypothetical protein BCV69DRAFT_92426 [Pseudomicrostroma glucosiphilum]PWN22622.1 hypothetical protein BCV69DRAFT_92426 [Pseudomicrostroma glucosiphilum]